MIVLTVFTMTFIKPERICVMPPEPADKAPQRLLVRACLRVLMMCSLLFTAVGGSVALADAPPQTGGQGRYIVYLEPALETRFADTALRGRVLADWQARVGARISVERQLATGGWVLVLTPDHDTDEGEGEGEGKAGQLSLLEGLEGVASVEVDALMRRY